MRYIPNLVFLLLLKTSLIFSTFILVLSLHSYSASFNYWSVYCWGFWERHTGMIFSRFYSVFLEPVKKKGLTHSKHNGILMHLENIVKFFSNWSSACTEPSCSTEIATENARTNKWRPVWQGWSVQRPRQRQRQRGRESSFHTWRVGKEKVQECPWYKPWWGDGTAATAPDGFRRLWGLYSICFSFLINRTLIHVMCVLVFLVAVYDKTIWNFQLHTLSSFPLVVSFFSCEWASAWVWLAINAEFYSTKVKKKKGKEYWSLVKKCLIVIRIHTGILVCIKLVL